MDPKDNSEKQDLLPKMISKMGSQEFRELTNRIVSEMGSQRENLPHDDVVTAALQLPIFSALTEVRQIPALTLSQEIGVYERQIAETVEENKKEIEELNKKMIFAKVECKLKLKSLRGKRNKLQLKKNRIDMRKSKGALKVPLEPPLAISAISIAGQSDTSGLVQPAVAKESLALHEVHEVTMNNCHDQTLLPFSSLNALKSIYDPPSDIEILNDIKSEFNTSSCINDPFHLCPISSVFVTNGSGTSYSVLKTADRTISSSDQITQKNQVEQTRKEPICLEPTSINVEHSVSNQRTTLKEIDTVQQEQPLIQNELAAFIANLAPMQQKQTALETFRDVELNFGNVDTTFFQLEEPNFTCAARDGSQSTTDIKLSIDIDSTFFDNDHDTLHIKSEPNSIIDDLGAKQKKFLNTSHNVEHTFDSVLLGSSRINTEPLESSYENDSYLNTFCNVASASNGVNQNPSLGVSTDSGFVSGPTNEHWKEVTYIDPAENNLMKQSVFNLNSMTTFAAKLSVKDPVGCPAKSEGNPLQEGISLNVMDFFRNDCFKRKHGSENKELDQTGGIEGTKKGNELELGLSSLETEPSQINFKKQAHSLPESIMGPIGNYRGPKMKIKSFQSSVSKSGSECPPKATNRTIEDQLSSACVLSTPKLKDPGHFYKYTPTPTSPLKVSRFPIRKTTSSDSVTKTRRFTESFPANVGITNRDRSLNNFNKNGSISKSTDVCSLINGWSQFHLNSTPVIVPTKRDKNALSTKSKTNFRSHQFLAKLALSEPDEELQTSASFSEGVQQSPSLSALTAPLESIQAPSGTSKKIPDSTFNGSGLPWKDRFQQYSSPIKDQTELIPAQKLAEIETSVQLSKGALKMIFNGETFVNPILQVLAVNPTAGDKYGLVVSDGANKSNFVLLSQQLNHFITENKLDINCILKLEKYTCHDIGKSLKLLIISEIVLIFSGAVVKRQIGNPTTFDQKSSSQEA